MKHLMKTLSLTLLVASSLMALSASAVSPEIPGPPQTTPIALVGATVHPVSGPAIEDATVVFDQGKIVAVGKQVTVPAGAQVIRLSGKHVYPALFDPYTNLGLVEISSVRATLDYRETGSMNPNVQAQVAVNPDSEAIPVTRSNGVLLALTAPTGGRISGKSCVLQLDGWTWEDLTLAADVGMHVQWPFLQPVSGWWPEDEAPRRRFRGGDGGPNDIRELEQLFDQARNYRQARQHNAAEHPADARLEALLPVLDGKLPLIIDADRADQIQSAVAFCQRQQVRMVLLGGYDAPHCAVLLKQHKIPVIISSVYRNPSRRDDDYDASYSLAERLRQAGIAFCISGSSRVAASNVRNLPYHAATAAAYGLPRDEALKAITLYPAQILGVADRVGSLEAGKDATLIVTDGDPLETPTQVEAAYIQGRQVELNDRHKRLYRKYGERIERRAKAAN